MLAGSALALLYAAALAAQLIDHAFWRDEAQAWLISRASASPLELRQNLRFEGHPPLWHLVLWPIARSSEDPELMKVLTFSIGCAFGVVVALGRAVPPLLRPALLAGFLPIFGYGVLSRPYLLGLLLMFAYLELLHRSGSQGGGLLGIRLSLIVLLSLTHLLYAVVAGALLLGEILDACRHGDDRRRRAIPIGATVLAVLLSIAASLPDLSGPFVPRSVELDRIGIRTLLIVLAEAGAPLLPVGPSTRLAVLALLSALIGMSVMISPRRSGPMVLGVSLLLVNRLVGYGTGWWHVGVTTFALIVLALLALRREALREDEPRATRLVRPVIALLTLLLLTGQVFAAMLWSSDERSALPYSSAREAAAIVRGWCGSECPIVVDWSPAGVTVSAYLGAQPVFRLDDRREGTFGIWDRQFGTGDVSWDALRDALEERGNRSVGVVSILREPPEGFIVIGETGPAVWRDEEFLVVTLAPSQ